MQKISSDLLYFETDAHNEVTHRVQPGERFEVQTQLNKGAWIDQLPDNEQQEWREKLRGGNPSSGCIHVEGARAGDALRVEIHQIELDPLGYTQFGGWNAAMPGWLEIGKHSKVVKISDGLVHWSEALKLPVRPMLGFVGVAPQRERFHNGWGGTWGGNLDAQEIEPGVTLHLRVNHEGALLHIGDMHAIQGDGEICGAGGIEASGRVQLTCHLSSHVSKEFVWPRFENETHIGVIANARPAEDAFRAALKDLLLWLETDYSLPRGEGYLLLGQVLEARVTQFVNPTFTYLTKVNKAYLSGHA